MSDITMDAKRRRLLQDTDMVVEYRTLRSLGIPDVGATVRKWAAQATPAIGDATTMAPMFLRSIFYPRVSIFDMLSTELHQS